MVYLAPSAEDAAEYLEIDVADGQDDDEQTELDAIESALAAETAAQLKVIRLPREADPLVEKPYPADLAEALLRRVAHNLQLRRLPLGLQATIADGVATTNYVGGTDAEVRRLEKPYAPRTVG